jgi:hypothetical protein
MKVPQQYITTLISVLKNYLNKIGIRFLFMNRWSNLLELRFDNACGKAHQEISLIYDPTDTLAYQFK